MKQVMKKWIPFTLCFSLLSCGGSKDDARGERPAGLAPFTVLEQSDGVTPFIKTFRLGVDYEAAVASVSYTIAPKKGTHSKPISVTYAREYLERRGYYSSSRKEILLPVFGLYAGYGNKVTLSMEFADGSTSAQQVNAPTRPHADPPYGAVEIKRARAASSALNFDYVLIKSLVASPVVIDTDGNTRWMGPNITSYGSSAFIRNGFVVGSQSAPDLYRFELDGTYSSMKIANAAYTNFHHELNPGKTGLLAQFDVNAGGVQKTGSVLAEIDAGGRILKEWDLGEIFRNAMRRGGDDPAGFVREDVDWFHMNSAVYSPSDNALLISSRENFVVKIDYDSGAIKWILGDAGKHWYANYPSLRAYALTLQAGKAPIGQHSLSIASDGNLLLFNNGLGSQNNPAGTPAGQTRAFSTASKYAIDEAAKTAREIWTFENERKIYSAVCSSVYESGVGNYLVNYSVAYDGTRAKLIGLESSGDIAFDFEYPTKTCGTSWNASPIEFRNIVFR